MTGPNVKDPSYVTILGTAQLPPNVHTLYTVLIPTNSKMYQCVSILYWKSIFGAHIIASYASASSTLLVDQHTEKNCVTMTGMAKERTINPSQLHVPTKHDGQNITNWGTHCMSLISFIFPQDLQIKTSYSSYAWYASKFHDFEKFISSSKLTRLCDLHRYCTMTSSNEIIFRVTDPLWAKFTSH